MRSNIEDLALEAFWAQASIKIQQKIFYRSQDKRDSE
jgi:hypothetical protein